MKRYKMGKRASRRSFTKAAVRVNKRNLMSSPMRGGIRL